MDNISEIMYATRMLMRFDKRFSEDEVVAFEELIDGDFKTFIDENGNATENRSEIVDALCHFSYHFSNGEYVLNNIKGVKNGPDHQEKPNTFCLTTPAFHSKTTTYGPTDRGTIGIQDFFKAHHCSAICKNFVPEITEADHIKTQSAPLHETQNEQNQVDVGNVLPPSYEESEAQEQKTNC